MPSTIDATKPLAGSLITSAEIRALALAAKTDIEELQSNQEAKANANLTINGQALTGNVTLTTANISDSIDKRYVNESQLASINNITQSSNHSALSNLNWTQSGHTGNASTIAGFDTNGTARFLTTNGSGSVVLNTNATLTNANFITPILGTPQSGNLTNCNGNATNVTAGNVSFLNLSANTTNLSGTLAIDRGGVDLTAWDTYTPSLSGITLGNGTLTGSYKKIGRTVFYKINLIFGSTTSITGNVSIGTPTTIVGSAAQPLAEVFFLDANVGYYSGRQFGNGAVLYMSNPITGISATTPFTWTTSDAIFIKGFYESLT